MAMFRHLIDEIKHNKRPGTDLYGGYGFTTGYPQDWVRHYARAHGLTALEVYRKKGSKGSQQQSHQDQIHACSQEGGL